MAYQFCVPRLTRVEVAAALVAHIQATKHQACLIVPVPDRPAGDARDVKAMRERQRG